MKKNKYYVPEISELYIGFECEKHDTYFNDCKPIVGYQKHFICEENFDLISCYIRQYRVKYIDSEDIKSLGFTSDPSGERYFELNGYQLYIDIHTDFNVTIYNDDPIIIFQGLIKNKSELKRVLKMIGVIE